MPVQISVAKVKLLKIDEVRGLLLMRGCGVMEPSGCKLLEKELSVWVHEYTEGNGSQSSKNEEEHVML